MLLVSVLSIWGLYAPRAVGLDALDRDGRASSSRSTSVGGSAANRATSRCSLNSIAVFYLNQRDLRAGRCRRRGADGSSDRTVDAHGPRAASPPRAAAPVHAWRAVLPDGRWRVRRALRPARGSDPARGAASSSPPGRSTSSGSPPPATRCPGRRSSCASCPKPMGSIELARWRNRPGRPASSPRRVGWPGSASLARLVDAGLVALAAAPRPGPGRHDRRRVGPLRRRSAATDPRVVYHGRVVREGRWVVLHYMFLYAMNDWRSTFEGANDHEADSEQCFVVCERSTTARCGRRGSAPPRTTRRATTSAGDGTTRACRSIDGHPIVFPGAGSHATYLEQGEYIMRLPFPGERNLRGPLDLHPRGSGATRSTSPTRATSRRAPGGRSASRSSTTRAATASRSGPGGDVAWTPIVIGDEDGWVDRYHGLWGLDTGDRFAGERAPAGPKYTRTGTVRQSWHDPLGFAGLDKMAPPSQAIPTLTRGSRPARDGANGGARRGRRRSRRALPLLDAEVAAIREAPGIDAYRAAAAGGAPRRARSSSPALRDQAVELGTADRRRRATARRSCGPASSTTRASTSITRPSRNPRSETQSTRARRGVGGAQRRPPRRRPRGHRLVPDPARRSWPSSSSSAPTSPSSRSSARTSGSCSCASPSRSRSSASRSLRSTSCARSCSSGCSASGLLLIVDNVGELRRRARSLNRAGARDGRPRRMCCNGDPRRCRAPTRRPCPGRSAPRGDPWASAPLPAP